MNLRCPICGLYELNDGSEETLWTCECEGEVMHCDECGEEIPDDKTYYVGPASILCKECVPGEEIGERQ